MRISPRVKAFVRAVTPLAVVLCAALIFTLAPREHRDIYKPASTPSLEAYNNERAVRLREHRTAGVYVYADVSDIRLYAEATLPSAFRDSQKFGSGSVISTDGYVLSAEHVVTALCPPPKVAGTHAYCAIVPIGHTRAYRARVIKTDKKRDLALLRIEHDDSFAYLRVVPEAYDATLEGREVQVLGIPLGWANTAVTGIISNAPDLDERCEKHQSRVTIAIAPGNSGGAVMDMGTGMVVGVVSQVYGAKSGNGQEAVYLNVMCSTHPKYIREFLRL